MFRKIFIFFFLFCFPIGAVDIGSDTAVTRFNTLQVVENGDRVAGFAALAGGLVFDGPNVTGTWDCFFPLSGSFGLAFGHLILNQDLKFNNLSQVTVLGDVSGNGHTVELSANMECIPSTFGALNCDISFLDNIAAPAVVNSVSWNQSSEFVAIGVNSSGGDELLVYSWDGTTLTLEDSVSLRTVNSVSWHPTNDWIAVGTNGGGGDDLFNYEFSGGTLTLLDSVNIGGGSSHVNSVAWNPDGDHLAIGTDDNAIELRVYAVNGSGVFGASVTVNLAQDVNAVDWNDDGTFLVAGTDVGGGFDELRVYSFSTGPLTLTLNASVDTGLTVNSVSWNKRATANDEIAVGLNGGANNLELYRHTSGSLTEIITGITVSPNVNSVFWDFTNACLAAGLDANANEEIRLYTFVDDTLIQDGEAEIGFNVNGVAFSPNSHWLATGDDNNDLSVYQLDLFVAARDVIFSQVVLKMSSNLTLRDTSITFSGESMIDGNGNTLTLAPTFTLLVANDSSVLLRDVILDGLTDSSIRMLDASSTLSLQSATFTLDEDFTFSLGHLDIMKDFRISGQDRTFVYTSDQQSVIRGGVFNSSDECSPFYSGTLIVDNTVTFSYAPASGSDTLLQLESEFSKIILNGGNLVADILSLTKGTVRIDGKSTLHAGTSITLGDGITAANNIHVEILPAANVEVIGNLIYNNV